MVPAVAHPPRRIAILGYPIIALRLGLMIMLLIICVPLHYLWKLLGLDRMWPRIFLAGVGAIAGLHIRRRGKRVKGALLLSNHISWLDIPALAHAANSAFVAHDGLAQFGLLKWLCTMNETVFIARDRRASVTRQAEDIRAALDHGGTLTLFPEGTTSDGTGLLAFKSSLLGALEPLPAGAVIQPVLLAYEDVPEISWVGDEPGLDNFKRILARFRPIRLNIHFLPPLSGEEVANRKAMTAAAREALRRTQSSKQAVL
ncbi:lyso-ornithine lipid acyltransferase [Aurantiacibacter atlanticus]|uniref:Lyso-ornithine lipid acyltransferase n=2 Tax=Aurantiacibacter atlanticus TaxID=1648404 RepID=A0A0H4VXH5_9SPHN|nr:lyso-ornithine lipid acyltransferase [Aurantiacibacter atlanticus]